MQVKSLPQIHGEKASWRDGRYRLYTVEHIDFDALPAYSDGGPSKVVVDGYSMSTSTVDRLFSSASVIAADDGMHTLNLSKPVFDEDGHLTGGYDKHELDGTRWATRRDAERAAFEAGATAFMVYERDAARLGLPTAEGEAAAAQSDAALEILLQTYGGHTPRDEHGNLRELTSAERTFGQAIRAEARQRGIR